MRIFSYKDRPFHLGPYPLETLARTDAAPDLSAVPPMTPLVFRREDAPEKGLNVNPDNWQDTFREATWDEALDTVARRFSEIKETTGPDSLGVLTSARITNEENYIANKFARAVLKTNNIDHCARL